MKPINIELTQEQTQILEDHFDSMPLRDAVFCYIAQPKLRPDDYEGPMVMQVAYFDGETAFKTIRYVKCLMDEQDRKDAIDERLRLSADSESMLDDRLLLFELSAEGGTQ